MATKAPKGTIVEEDRRLFLRKQLEDFRDGNNESLRFPANLSNVERKFVHKVSAELNLVSKSAGAGTDRFISIWKRDSSTAPASSQGMANKIVPWELSASTRKMLASANLDSVLQTMNRDLDAVTVAEDSSKAKRVGRIHRLSEQLPRIRDSYHAAEARRRANPHNAERERKRATLPAAEHRQDVISTIKREQIVLISGETGCGKSTQIPQFLLEDTTIGPNSRIVITQPRRISAISLAERIAFERSEQVGDTIGYNIRMENKLSAHTQVLFVTPGVLLRKLLEDPDLDEFSHVIVDEAHERDRFTEFLLIVLRDIAQRRSSLKLVLMSATMHTHKLCAYFGDIPQINVGGSVFPVQEFFLEHVLKFIHYTPRSLAAVTASNLAAPLALTESASFYCSVCHNGPFVSSEELGTHCALCFPNDIDGFVQAYLGQRQVSLSARSKQQKLEALLRRLAWIRSSVKPSATANNSSWIGTSSTSSSSAAAAGGEGDGGLSHNGYEIDGDEDSDLDEEDYFPEIYRTSDARDASEGGIGERFLHSEESAELNQLLKLYQRDLEDTADASSGSNALVVGNMGGNAGSNSDVDYALIIALIRFIVSSEFGRDHGSILVFLPGWDDISKLHRLLQSCEDFAVPSKYLLLQLHSGVPKKEQQLVFQPVSQVGQRKIILSTNIAETSVTIDDVSVVIDSMLVKEKAYDAHTKLSYLKSTYISQASARQRKGRAGRTRAGVCFRLCSVLRARHLKDYQDSELLRMSLEELVLQSKALHLADGAQGALQFLSKALDPPSELAIQQAVLLLQSLQCLSVDGKEELTALGDAIAQLPMSPRQGKMLLLGCLVGVSSTAVQCAAVVTGRDPFLLPASDMQRMKVNKEKQAFGSQSMCDQYAVYKALEYFAMSMQRHGRSDTMRWCLQHELSAPSCQFLVDSAYQLDKSLRELTLPSSVGIPTNHSRCVRNLGSIPLTLFMLAMGLYPDFAVRLPGGSLFITEKGAKARVHPSSINGKLSKQEAAAAASPSRSLDIICFQDLIALNAFAKNYRIGGPEYLMLQTTPVSVLGLCILCGSLAIADASALAASTTNAAAEPEDAEEVVVMDGDRDVLVIDGWLRLSVPKDDAQLVLSLRSLLQQALTLLIRQPALLMLTTNASSSSSSSSSASLAGVNTHANEITRALDVALGALSDAQQEILRSQTLPASASGSASGSNYYVNDNRNVNKFGKNK